MALVRPETMTFLLLIFGLIGASYLSPFFLDINYILRSFTLTAEMSIVALVLTMVIISGEIDLSPAANMALSACIFAWVQAAGAPIYLAVLVALFAGLAMGALNAFMSIRMQLPSIIVTIGTLIFFRGLAQVIAGDKSIRVPDSFIGINTVMIAGIPLPVVIFFAMAIILGFVLGATIIGRQIYQIGTNKEAALHAGINSTRIKVGLFLLLGLVSAAAGIMAVSRLGSVRYDLVLGRITNGSNGDAGRHIHFWWTWHDLGHISGCLAFSDCIDRHDSCQSFASHSTYCARYSANRCHNCNQFHLCSNSKITGKPQATNAFK